MFAYIFSFLAVVLFLIIGPIMLIGFRRNDAEKERQRIRRAVKLRPADEQFTEPEMNGGRPT